MDTKILPLPDSLFNAPSYCYNVSELLGLTTYHMLIV
jgi:hypothetical protein